MLRFRKSAGELAAATQPPEQLIQSFEQRIIEQDDLLYGVALYFEGVTLLSAGQDAVIQTYRRQFRNVIQMGRQSVEDAQELLAGVKSDPTKASLIEQFEFSACRGFPEPERMAQRARILVDAYKELFPDRPRAQPFTDAETLSLIVAAGEALPLQDKANVQQ